MIFNNKPKKCWKCQEEILNDRFTVTCDKCNKVCNYSSVFRPRFYKYKYENEARYIMNFSIKDNGLEWYKKARDKLLRKIDEEEKAYEKAEFVKRQKYIKRIDKWK